MTNNRGYFLYDVLFKPSFDPTVFLTDILVISYTNFKSFKKM